MKKTKSVDPILTAAARGMLKARIRIHPEAAKYVSSSDEVSTLKKAQLLSIARKLGIDVSEVASKAAANPKSTGVEIEAAADRAEGYAFAGEILFDFEAALLGTSFKRRGKIVYEHTPAWNHLDTSTGAERLGRDQSSFGIEIEAVLEEREVWESRNGKSVRRKNVPYWTSVEGFLTDGVLPESLIERIYNLIDEDARRQDVSNRTRIKET